MQRSWLPVRLILAGTTAAVVIGFLGFVDGDAVAHGLEVLALGGPLWFAPVVLYVVATRTRFGVISVGTSLLVCTYLALRAVYTDGSSTAALGILFFPIYFVLALCAYLVVEWGTLSLVRRARHRTR